MPHAVAAGIASTALTAPVVAGGLGALGTGLALGTKIAGAGGIFSNFMAGAAPGLAGTLGGVTPAVAANLAPAATSQLLGTIGGGVAPGAFGANLAGAAAPGLTGTVGGVAPGAFGANLTGAGQGLAGAANQSFASQLAAAQQQAALRSAQLGNQTTGMGFQKAATDSASRYVVPEAIKGGSMGPTQAQIAEATGFPVEGKDFLTNAFNLFKNPSWEGAKAYASEHPYATAAGAYGLYNALKPEYNPPETDKGMIRPYTYERTQRPEAYVVSPGMDSSERLYFNDQFIAGEPYKAATGGIVSLAVGGPVEGMSAMNSVGMNTGYPMANLQTPMYSNPSMQRPEATNVIAPSADAGVAAYSGEQRFSNGGPAFMGPVGSGYVGAGNYIENARLPESTAPRPGSPGGSDAPLPKYSYNPETMQFTQTVGGNKVSGGITRPAMGSMQTQPPQQAAPAYPALNIPAYQSPEQQLGLTNFYDYMNQQLGGFGGYAGYARGGNVGGESHLGDYSDGGRLLKGPGDGVSDSIPASIGNRQPARLADGEFVVPARIVSELGNGSTEAGARKLYAMMDRIQKARKKSVGKNKVAVNSKSDKHLPA
jgi:hypothetical protein